MTITLEPRTQGQHDVSFDLVRPYAEFPKKITGPTVWTASELKAHPERWITQWDSALVKEMEDAYDNFRAKDLPLTSISRATFPLPQRVTTFLRNIRGVIVHGQGLILIRGLPVTEWPIEKSAAIYLAIGTILGHRISQNGKGHVLGHVKDLGNDPKQLDRVRIYSTAARQFFHADAGDIVGLLCLHKAKEGGESDVVSSHHVWNTIQAERPDIAEVLVKPNWYFDRKGEVSPGQNGWVQKSVFYFHDGKVLSHYDPYFVKSIGRHVEAGLIPGLTAEQLEAIDVLEQTAQRLSLHMVLDVGDIQFVADTHVLHARTAYIDYPAPLPRRHLLRLWLATPEREGGWKRPFADSAHMKRGGIQVGDQEETCPLDAE